MTLDICSAELTWTLNSVPLSALFATRLHSLPVPTRSQTTIGCTLCFNVFNLNHYPDYNVSCVATNPSKNSSVFIAYSESAANLRHLGEGLSLLSLLVQKLWMFTYLGICFIPLHVLGSLPIPCWRPYDLTNP
jgi:hypothetical protein